MKSKKGTTGGSKMPASKLGPDGSFSRADLHTGVSPTEGTGTSIFDPVLCEICYRWFCPKDGLVFDPFAGGSVRGVVASVLERNYIGLELRKEQVEANELQGKKIEQAHRARWICGDSVNLNQLCKGIEADFLFSCPPYADLEVYSDDPRDISTMAYAKFLEVYSLIIRKSLALLKDDRFAVFVVGEVREKKKSGFYYGFVSDTIRAFEAHGARLYNEAILVTAVGSLPIRTARMFTAGRKLGKTHQNVLIFCKGDPKKATEACGKVDITGALSLHTGEVLESPVPASVFPADPEIAG